MKHLNFKVVKKIVFLSTMFVLNFLNLSSRCMLVRIKVYINSYQPVTSKRILLLNLMFLSVFASAQVTFLNPKPTNVTIYDVFFINDNYGFMVGDLGSILKTTDGGITWTSLTSGTNSCLNSISFVDSNNGYIVGSVGTILKTTNGGVTWETLYNNIYSTLSSVSFINENVGFIGGKDGTYKTIDGGKSWERVNTKTTVKLYFGNENKGYALISEGMFGDIYLYKTINSGITWLKQPISTGYPISDFYFTNVNTGYITGDNGIIYKTTNGGMSWSTLNTGTTASLNLPFFVNDSIGYVQPNLQTTDGGSTWNRFSSPSKYSTINSVFFTNSKTGFLVGGNDLNGSTILKTTDGCQSWNSLVSKLNKNLSAVHFPSMSTGYAVGDSGSIYKTENSGESWIKLSINTQKLLSSVFFVDNSTGFVVVDDNSIFKTSNGGSTWNPTVFKDVYKINSVFFANKDIGYVVGTGNKIFKTTNGGEKWSDISFTNDFSLASVYFTDANTGYVVGNDYYDGSMIMKTSDGGITWDYIWTSNDNNNEYDLMSVRFVNVNFGYVTFYLDNSYRDSFGYLVTYDGGSTWMEDPGFRDVGDFYFTTAEVGYYVGPYGFFYKTINGGSSWWPLTSGTAQNLRNIFFTDPHIGYAVGANGTILRITDETTSNNEINLQKSLFEIYPNPAKDIVTILGYDDFSNANNVRIFSINGEELKQKKSTNGKKILLNVSNLKSGIYLIKLQNANKSECRKLIINN